jgi:filamentous hemagglutinin
MNKHCYRIVFNRTRGLLMAVSERVASDGKARGTSRAPLMRNRAAGVAATVRPLQYSMLLAWGLVSLPAHAQIVADRSAPGAQQPTVLTAGNGVPVVNIQTPSRAGVSRNSYSQFDVHSQGAILNNARKAAETQLGGWVQGNPWLAGGSARVILNEVNGSHPSLLRGYIEVAGSRAQVVIANPAGISCDGCGFINANRATLTTGIPLMNAGNLDGYRVTGGAIGISGAGLDASRTDFTDIIARSVQVNAAIWANTLKVTTGANEVSADHVYSTATASNGVTPAYGLDVANLGGMYAGKITLVGTESGVGVRNAGAIGASASDVIVTADGRLENSGRITASGAVRADTSGSMTNTGTVYAQGDTRLTTRGNVANGGTIAAQGDTSVAAAGMIDSQPGSLLGAGIRSDGALGASGTLELAATGQLNARGQNIAGGDLSASGAAISIAGSQTAATHISLTAAGGDIDASAAAVAAAQTFAASASGLFRADDAAVSAERLSLAAHGISNVRGNIVQTGTSDLSIRVPGQFDNTNGRVAANSINVSLDAQTLNNRGGTIAVNGTASVRSGTLDNTEQGSITARAEAKIVTASLVNAKGSLTAGGALNVEAKESIDNAGGLIGANQNLSVSGSAVDNADGLVGSVHGAATVSAATGRVDNTAGRIEAAQAVKVSSSGLANTDGVIAGSDVRIDSRGQSVDNERGAIVARGLLDVRSGKLTNDAGLVQAAGALEIDTHGHMLSNTNSGAAGGILGRGAVTLRTGKLDNTAGFIGAKGEVMANAGSIVNAHGGQIAGEEALSLIGAHIDNRAGKIQALGKVELGASDGTVDNSGGLMRSGDRLAVRAQALLNRGTQGDEQGMEAQNIGVTADAIDNHSGAMRADGLLSLTGAGTVDNSEGLISSAQSVQIQDRQLADKTQRVTNTGGTLIAGKSLGVKSAELSGDGSVLSRGDLDVSVNGDFVNTGNVEASGNVGFQTTGQLTNRAAMRAGAALNASASTIDNTETGELSAVETQVAAAGGITNRGLIDGQDTTVSSGVVSNKGMGRIYGDHLAISAGTLNNDAEKGAAATIAARSRLDIGAQTVNNRDHALIFSAGDMAIGGALDGSRVATGSAATVNNNSASIEALGNLTMAAVDVNNTNEHFAIDVQPQGAPEHIVEYQGDGSANRYRPDDPGVQVYNDESDHLRTPERSYESWHKYEYDRRTTATVIAESDPAKITSGGVMRIDALNVLNDKSQIVAGGALTGTIAKLNNTEVAGKQTVTDSGTVTSHWRNHKKGRDDTGRRSAPYTPPPAIAEIKLTPTVYTEFTAPGNAGVHIGAVNVGAVTRIADSVGAPGVGIRSGRVVTPITEVSAPALQGGAQSFMIRSTEVNTTVPAASLFSVNPNPAGSYLIETDPRFVNYRNWLSSDYMLEQLRVDPALTQKRLGDAFYEQKLVREQVAKLTGRRFLEGYASDEAEYRALIDSGVTYGKAWGLRPGVGLTAEQMARLTSDMVWLVEKEVALPDGQTTKALVPQVYVRVKQGDIDGSGALVSAQALALDASGDIANEGTIAGRDFVALKADNVKNLGGRITGSDVAVRALTDLTNLGGTIDAANSLFATAGRDIESISTTSTQANGQGTITNVSRVAGFYVTNPSGGTLLASAGRDLKLAGAQIGNASVDGQTLVAAGRDLNLTTVDTSSSQSLTWDRNNWREDSTQREIGSSIHTAGDVRLSAGHDLNARGASVTSEQGALVATAGHDVNLTSSQTIRDVDEAHRHKGNSSWFSSKTISTRNTLSETTNQATTFSGNTAYVQAGNDINLKGSNVVSTDGTALVAAHDVNIDAATDSLTERHFRKEMKTGLFGNGGMSFTVGTQQQSQDNADARTTVSGSTVGATNGKVAIKAGNRYTQTGSDVVALGGDVEIDAKKVAILEAEETSHSTQETVFKQSGLTVSVTAPVIAAVQTAGQMKHAAGQTSDPGMKALAGAATALAAKNAADAVASDPKSGGGVNIAITVGGSTSRSKTTEDTVQAVGSNVAAGGNVTIRATGADQDSTLTVQGSEIKGGGNVKLKADGEIQLLAADNMHELHRTSSSAGGGVGVAVSVSSQGASVGVTANASGSRGRADGTDVTWTNTRVSAGKKLILESGGDTTLRGAVASGEQVVAHVGGDLNIESLQDVSGYRSKDQSIGGSVTAGAGVSASANIGQQKMKSDFASVMEQSGIKAGDAGFQIDVKGNTDLKGGAITSTEKAVADDVNSLVTATLTTSDIENRAQYSASSFAAGGGYSFSGGGTASGGDKGNTAAGGVGTNQQGQATTGGDKVPGNNVATSGNWSATPPAAMAASGSGSSTTVSGVSGGAIRITDDATQRALTGKGADEVVASVNRDVTTEHDGTNALTPIFDENEIRAGFEIVGALQRETGTFLANRAKASSEAQRELDSERAKPEGERDAGRMAQLTQVLEENATWGPGGAGRRVLTALTAAAGGNVTGATSQFVQAAGATYLQTLGAEQIKALSPYLGGEGSAAHTALHAVLGCAGGAASGGECGAGALGASAGVVLNSVLDQASRTEGLDPSEKDARANLVASLVAGVAQAMGADSAQAATAAQVETLFNRQLNQSEYDDAKRHAKTVAKELGISEQEAEGRIVAEILRNSDKQTAEASGGKHDYEVRRIVGCQSLNCNGYKNDLQYANHAYNSEYIEPNRASYDLGQRRLGHGETYNELVTANINKDPVGAALAGVGLIGLGVATGGSLAPVGMMGVGTALGLGVNGSAQLMSEKPFDWASFGAAGVTGALSTGMRFTPVLFINVGGALTSSALNGENPNDAIGGAAVGTMIGYPIGAKVEGKFHDVLNPRYRQEWMDVGMGVSKYIPPSTIPSWVGGLGSGVIQEGTGSAVQNKVDGAGKK